MLHKLLLNKGLDAVVQWVKPSMKAESLRLHKAAGVVNVLAAFDIDNHSCTSHHWSLDSVCHTLIMLHILYT